MVSQRFLPQASNHTLIFTALVLPFAWINRDAGTYLVVFDRPELGSHHVRDIDVMARDPDAHLPPLLARALGKPVSATLQQLGGGGWPAGRPPLGGRARRSLFEGGVVSAAAAGSLGGAEGAGALLGRGASAALTHAIASLAVTLDQREAMLVQLKAMHDRFEAGGLAQDTGTGASAAGQLSPGSATVQGEWLQYYRALLGDLKANALSLQSSLAAIRHRLQPPGPAEMEPGAPGGAPLLGPDAGAVPASVAYMLRHTTALQLQGGEDAVAQQIVEGAVNLAAERVQEHQAAAGAADTAEAEGDGAAASDLFARHLAVFYALQCAAEAGHVLGSGVCERLLARSLAQIRPASEANQTLFDRVAELVRGLHQHLTLERSAHGALGGHGGGGSMVHYS